MRRQCLTIISFLLLHSLCCLFPLIVKICVTHRKGAGAESVGRTIVVSLWTPLKAEEKNYCETCTIKFYYHNNKLLAPWHEWLWRRHAHCFYFPDFSDSPAFTLRFPSPATWHLMWKQRDSREKLSQSSPEEFSAPHFLRREAPHCLCDTLVHYRFDFHPLNINLVRSRVMFTFFLG